MMATAVPSTSIHTLITTMTMTVSNLIISMIQTQSVLKVSSNTPPPAQLTSTTKQLNLLPHPPPAQLNNSIRYCKGPIMCYLFMILY